MEPWRSLFGENGQDLNAWQMALRTVAVFFLALTFIRISGMRSFGRKSAFDVTVTILLGAVLARAVTGSSPFWPTMAAGATLVLVKRVLSQLARHSKRLEHLVKGQHRVLYEHGKVDEKAMARSSLSEADLSSGLRASGNTERLEAVEKVVMEADGHITVVEK